VEARPDHETKVVMNMPQRDPMAAVRLLAAAPALLDALNLAVATIRIWHGIGMGQAEPQAWFLYQDSPEMKQINAALAEAEGR
jgi:hypothetical protein